MRPVSISVYFCVYLLYSAPESCHALDSNGSVVTGRANPLNADMIHNEDVIRVQEDRKGTSEDSRNKITLKTNSMLAYDRQNAV